MNHHDHAALDNVRETLIDATDTVQIMADALDGVSGISGKTVLAMHRRLLALATALDSAAAELYQMGETAPDTAT